MDVNLDNISNFVSRFLHMDRDELDANLAPAEVEDFEKLIEFRKFMFKFEPPWDDAAYIKWRYFSDANARKNNRIWLIKKDNEILGCVGIEEFTLVVHGEKHTAHKSMDLLVAPGRQGMGLGMWLLLVMNEKYPLSMVVGANKKSFPLAAKISKLMRPLQKYKLMLSAEAQLRKKLKSDLVSRIISIPVDKFLWWYINKGISLPEDYSSRLLDHIPDEVDYFNDQSDEIYVCRSKEYLTWRYLNNPRRDYILLGIYRGDRLEAISVSAIVFSEANSQKEGFIVDWGGDASSSDNLLSYLYLETIKYLKHKDAKLVHVCASHERTCNSLTKLGFIEREATRPFFVHAPNDKMREYLYNNDSWVLREGDSDTDLY